MRPTQFLGRCYQFHGDEITIRNTKGEEYITNRAELADLGRRYNYHEIGEEFGVGYVTAWRLFKDAGVRKKYVRRRKSA